MAEPSKRASAFVISPSIMRRVENLPTSNDPRFDLGMSEYTDSSEQQTGATVTKKRKLSLSLQKKTKSGLSVFQKRSCNLPLKVLCR